MKLCALLCKDTTLHARSNESYRVVLKALAETPRSESIRQSVSKGNLHKYFRFLNRRENLAAPETVKGSIENY